MPNPVPLATKEEEERRAWVTAHHEVVRLIKDCFGDRFSNNEIFDRLKISRRTGYRALGNDDRIGKAPGRKPKISDDTIRLMIEYIETGGCTDVGNVWKHLAEKFASDCNPKTVQDAVKKSGFKNYRNTVKLEPLLNEEIPDNQPTPDEENAQQLQQQQQQQQQQQEQQQAQDQQKYAYSIQQQESQQSPQQQMPPSQQPQPPIPQQHNAVDPSFQQYNIQEILRHAIETAPEVHVRYILWDLCNRVPDAERHTASMLIPHVASSAPSSVPQLSSSQIPRLDATLQATSLNSPEPGSAKRPRLAICRRCNQQYDRAENNMENRACLYHKGSPQKINPGDVGTIEESPEAFIWSCCGGNGMVRGCCRAMHTTKKKRKYGKKRDVTEAGLEADEDTGPDESTMMGVDNQLENQNQLDDPNIDASLQDMQPATLPSHVTMQMFTSELPSSFLQQGHLQVGQDSEDSTQTGLQQTHRLQSNGQMSHDVQTQLQMVQSQSNGQT